MRNIIVGLLFMFVSNALLGQTNNCKLNVVVNDLIFAKGNLMMQLVKDNGEVFKELNIYVEELPAKITIDSLPKGKYGLRYFYDENRNGSMDTYWGMIPSEGYGFSNNPYSKFGEPSLAKILFELNSDKALVLNTVNW